MADRQRTERIRIPLPDGFDPARHKTSLEQLIATEFGDGFEIDHIDPSAGAHGEAIAVRSVTLTEVMDQESTGRREVRLAKGTKPADGDRVAARFADQYPGEQMIEFQPFLGYAVVAPLDPATSRCRNAVAGALGAKPWDIKIDKRNDGGFDLQLPETYMPSRHDSKLQEIAEAVVGTLGWTIDTDPATARVAIVPGEPPSFPSVIPYPFNQPFVRYDAGTAWARIPLGMQLGTGPDPTDEFYLDLEAAPHSSIVGTSGGGKSVLINNYIAGAVARGAELVVVDQVAKAVDYFWCKQFVRPGGWGCDSLKESVTALALVYEEGQRRAALLGRHGVTKWTDLPADISLRPIVVIVDEVTGLFMPEEVPKGLPKDHELVTGPQEVNMLKATLRSYIAKLTAELRFVGVKVVVSTQVSSTTTGVPTSIRLNLAHKAQPLSARVPVPISHTFPTGWATIGDLSVGSEVFAVDGTVTEVVTTTPVETRPVYRVHFDDGQVVEADGEHLWEVSSHLQRVAQTPSASTRRAASTIKRRERCEQIRRSITGPTVSMKELVDISGMSESACSAALHSAGIVGARTSFEPQPEQLQRFSVRRRLDHFCAGDLASIPIRTGAIGALRIAAADLPADEWVRLADLVVDINPNSLGSIGVTAKAHCRHEKRDCEVTLERPVGHRYRLEYPAQSSLAALADCIEASRPFRPLFSVLRTIDILDGLRADDDRLSDFAVPLPAAVELPHADLPLDPYVLGAWLGDGSRGSGEIAQGTSEACTDRRGRTDQAHMIDQLLAFDPRPKPSSPDTVITTRGLKVKLRDLGVLRDKHIPAVYLRASIDQRLALVQGLMDTDGHVTKRGSCRFGNTSEQIAHGFLELLRSLGIKATISSRPSVIVEPDPDQPGRKRRRATGTTAYSVNFTTTLPVVRLPRKAERLIRTKTAGSADRLFITRIEQIEPAPVRCIGIAHPRSLYLTEQFVPTHNCLMGTKPTDNNRRVSLSDPTSVPKVPGNIQTDAAAGRGVGVAEPEGQEPCVFKGYFASTDQFAQWLESLGTPTTDRPSPTPAEVALHTPTLADGGGATAASSGRERGWGEVHVADGGGAASVSAAFAPTEKCSTCGGPIDPLTGACHCTR